MVYNYRESGVCQDTSGWEQAVSVALVQPDMYSLIDQWDHYLEHFSQADTWDPKRYNENDHNCYTFALTFINCVLITQGSRQLSKNEFTERFVLPRTKRASKYITLYQEISENHFYIVDTAQDHTENDNV
ncbi:MKRN2 opposite strand protein-like isoform X2 [Polypterus senegalus]|nr:MKRN2 opposite strand protein-like isoform X2 [Polypterus senegalus]